MNICSNCIHKEICEWCTSDETFKKCSNYLSERPQDKQRGTDVISYIDGLIDGADAVRPHGKWIYPYHDTIIGKRIVGKSIKQCSECDAYFCNNIPWDAKYCPICGSYNEKSNGINRVDNN